MLFKPTAMNKLKNCEEVQDKGSIYLLYTCDAWHTNNSRQLIAPFSSLESVYSYLEKNKRKYRLSKWDLDFFKAHGQTQHQDENLIMDTYKVDTELHS